MACVMPFARATGMCSLEGWTALAAASCGLYSPSSTVSTVAAVEPTSVKPRLLTESMIPG